MIAALAAWSVLDPAAAAERRGAAANSEPKSARAYGYDARTARAAPRQAPRLVREKALTRVQGYARRPAQVRYYAAPQRTARRVTGVYRYAAAPPPPAYAPRFYAYQARLVPAYAAPPIVRVYSYAPPPAYGYVPPPAYGYVARPVAPYPGYGYVPPEDAFTPLSDQRLLRPPVSSRRDGTPSDYAFGAGTYANETEIRLFFRRVTDGGG